MALCQWAFLLEIDLPAGESWKRVRQQLQTAETKLLDADSYRVHAVVSTEARDRAGDIIKAPGWQLDDFNKHPVLLSSHNYGSLRSQIGSWEEMQVKGKRLEGVARYYVGEGNEEADWAFRLAVKGYAAFSVGFIPDPDKMKVLEGGNDFFGPFEFGGQTLLEVSQVTVPANPEALQAVKALKLHPVTAMLIDGALKLAEADVPPKPKLADMIAERFARQLSRGRN